MQTSIRNNQKEVIEIFQCEGEEGYSEFWRRNKSPVEIYELARLLGGLRKVASYVGTNVGKIVWSGMDVENAIQLDPAPLLGQYPVPAAKTDQMVGVTIQKAYEKTEWTDRLRRLAMARMKLPPLHAYKFQLYFTMCERVYLDCLSNRSVFGNYTEIARLSATEKAQNLYTQPPNISELLHIWWGIAAERSGKKYKESFRDTSVRGGSQRTGLEKFYKEPIDLLNSIVDRMIYEVPKISGVSERGNYRLQLYYSIWPELFRIIEFWPTDAIDPYLQNHETSRFRCLPEAEKPEKPVWFTEKVEEIMGQKKPEFTPWVKEAVSNKEEVVPVKENNIYMPARKCVQKKLLQKLKFVIKTAAQKQTSFSRGLRSGKVDRRRLYRASTTGTIFQDSETEFELTNDITLLVDATGSMSAPNKWEKAEMLFQTLFSAIYAYNKKARLFAYNEVKNTCFLTELFLKEKFFGVLPHGKTASGEAIIAAAQNFTKGTKKPFIFHLTDGASNWGCGVENALAFCRRKGINLLTLGMGCDESAKPLLREEYGDLVTFVDNADALPRLLRDLLNKCRWM